MRSSFYCTWIATLCLAGSVLAGDDLDSLSGKWSTKKLNDEGQTVTQTLEIKKNKFTFRILAADSHLLLHAEGEIKLEKLGPFNSVRFGHLRAGESETDLNDVDDEYISVYSLDSDSWILATNFDKQRERQKPSLDNYKRVKTAATEK